VHGVILASFKPSAEVAAIQSTGDIRSIVRWLHVVKMAARWRSSLCLQSRKGGIHSSRIISACSSSIQSCVYRTVHCR
jgi:hypothetical protein